MTKADLCKKMAKAYGKKHNGSSENCCIGLMDKVLDVLGEIAGDRKSTRLNSSH